MIGISDVGMTLLGVAWFVYIAIGAVLFIVNLFIDGFAPTLAQVLKVIGIVLIVIGLILGVWSFVRFTLPKISPAADAVLNSAARGQSPLEAALDKNQNGILDSQEGFDGGGNGDGKGIAPGSEEFGTVDVPIDICKVGTTHPKIEQLVEDGIYVQYALVALERDREQMKTTAWFVSIPEGAYAHAFVVDVLGKLGKSYEYHGPVVIKQAVRMTVWCQGSPKWMENLAGKRRQLNAKTLLPIDASPEASSSTGASSTDQSPEPSGKQSGNANCDAPGKGWTWVTNKDGSTAWHIGPVKQQITIDVPDGMTIFSSLNGTANKVATTGKVTFHEATAFCPSE